MFSILSRLQIWARVLPCGGRELFLEEVPSHLENCLSDAWVYFWGIWNPPVENVWTSLSMGSAGPQAWALPLEWVSAEHLRTRWAGPCDGWAAGCLQGKMLISGECVWFLILRGEKRSAGQGRGQGRRRRSPLWMSCRERWGLGLVWRVKALSGVCSALRPRKASCPGGRLPPIDVSVL